ncbi:NADase-type glycan-binding domain-containing protein [Streptomyces inhibens]|uniref:NADase-type glycan-binding domain-containing protein n=1 Tax=Streptomyces inhibens TaxID=2293571 RepID=UPI001EE771CC|nr:zinc ribbon domain-containing protein [Streptomyces inhibens]UKY53287.1 zinc ribbon domain-containing protein [Streptomyces inhibens]
MATDNTTCPDCGAPAPQRGQSFCDSCGAFLRWERPAASTSSPPASSPSVPSPGTPQPASPPDAARTHPVASGPDGTHGRPGDPAAPRPTTGGATDAAAVPHQGSGEDPTTPLPAAAADDRGAGLSRPAPNSPEHPQSPDHPHGQGAPTHRPAAGGNVSDTGIRALLVPVPDASPTAPPEAPGSVLPGRPDAGRPRVRTPQAAPAPENGTPCPSCATPNAPRRHFCRSCATPLTDTARPEAEGPYAGQRPGLRRDRTRWITRAVVAAVIAAVVVGGIIGGPPAARAVQDHFAKRVPVPAAKWKASHSGPRNGPKLAFDNYSNTWWGTGYSGASDGQYLEAGFGQPTDLLNVLITPGASARTPQATDPARPHEFDLIVTDSAGTRQISHHRINDGGVQKIDVRVRDAMTVRLVLHSAYGATDAKQVAIAGLEFFGRSAG